MLEYSIQAAGHGNAFRFSEDKVFKKCNEGEQHFWEWLYKDADPDPLLDELKEFLPKYYGVEQIEGVIYKQQPYICIENLLHDFSHPCVMDVKLGRVTWTKDEPAEKIEKQKRKVNKTTSGHIGFTICGLVTRDLQGSKNYSWNKEFRYTVLTPENIHEYFSTLAYKSGVLRLDIVESFITQSQRILSWFRTQTLRHFIASSLLFVSGDEEETKCTVKLIDFAHVQESEGKLDSSKIYVDVIEALENVIRTWEKIKNTAPNCSNI